MRKKKKGLLKYKKSKRSKMKDIKMHKIIYKHRFKLVNKMQKIGEKNMKTILVVVVDSV
jgi:hypothetical protein